MQALRQTFTRINLTALRANIKSARAFLPSSVRLMVVAKADGYGHGLTAVGEAALDEGADFLGVALAEEGIILRKAGNNMPILCFGALNQAAFEAAARWNLTATVPDIRSAKLADRAARQAGLPLDIHVKLETGMNRIGVTDEAELREIMQLIGTSSSLRLKGAYTHFADADVPDSEYTHLQARRFKDLCCYLPEGLMQHAGASGGALFYPEYHFDMVRMGIALYGYPPQSSPLQFQPCLELSAEVSFIKTIGAGEPVGYGCTFTAQKSMRVATLGIGYGDGYPRAMGNRGRALIRNTSCPIIGRVCMDQCMADVSMVPDVRPGDEAVLVGSRGCEYIGADELAKLCDTIPYEILLHPGRRVPRYYSVNEELYDAEESKQGKEKAGTHF